MGDPQCLTPELPLGVQSPSPQANVPALLSGAPTILDVSPVCLYLSNNPATRLEIPPRPRSDLLPKPCFCRILHLEQPPLGETCPSSQNRFSGQLLDKVSPACAVGAISELQAWRRSWMMAFR